MTATTAWARVRDAAFGDRRGWAVFLAAAVAFGLTWRLGFFINDTVTVANTLVNVADGHLDLAAFPYQPHTATPGMHVVDGRLYGRNYGQVVLSLPALGALALLDSVVSLRVALAAAWCLGVLALCHETGVLLDEPVAFDRLGALAAVALFAVTLPLATTIDPLWTAQTALQLVSLLAAAFGATVLYRLVAAVESPRVGVAAGLALALATPFGFWATIPKRHALVATGTLLGLYCFYRSRAAETPEDRLRFRVAAYAAGALLAWTHPFEALAYCIALAAVDLPTRPPTDARTLGALAGGFLLALLPFLATNVLVAGNALTPPRLTPDFDGDPSAFAANATTPDATTAPDASTAPDATTAPDASTAPDATTAPDTASASDTSASSVSGTTKTAASSVSASAGTLYARVAFFASYVAAGVHVLSDPDRLYHTFVRSGWIAGVASEDQNRAVSLSVLESMPLATALLALPLAANRRLPDSWRDPSPVRALDAVVAVYLVLFTLAYLPRLPLHAMVNLRYLVPAFAVATYAVVRVPAVVRALDETQVLAWTYAATVLVGGQLLVVAIALAGLWTVEALQLHALVSLAAAAGVVAWLVLETAVGPRPRLGALALGLAAAVTTLFCLLGAWLYLPSGGDFALPTVRWLADHLAPLGR
ncbi:hypothetical protein [Halocalculus aciditolerans]|uniref:Glycosyltransferase RgtA/B/C/D-like domain-containing protein n=1 Tax=Halocalculus aciditolerans TaxID=1383812 RepID=A0A830FCN0_9EURY|nr:hypothetical protein [Halocalculus aciditolerans]GGL61490.1 hypothetical protein GCM10009039_19600 [Halocalculus aciditolerans]